jgi:hypothetical protein
MMKTIFIILSFLTLAFTCKAQHNNIANTEYSDVIKFNNVSLRSIRATKGNLTQMRSLFGNDIQEELNYTGVYITKYLWNENIMFGFEDETDTGNEYYLISITVENPSVVVNVKNLSIRIGDDKSKFGRAAVFHSSSSSYNFIDADTGSASLSFRIDPLTNKVIEIKFILF